MQLPDAEPEPSPDHSPPADTPAPQSNLSYLVGPSVPSPSNTRLRENHLREKADSIVCEWMKLEVDWVQVSLLHHPPPSTDKANMKSLKQIQLERKTLLTLSNALGTVWNLFAR
ncbi:unnamed protein product [Phytophthora lilii]|uniref:Unnamed protein product n=1 Tax=Phytophthora lilii TaxID=2077276 RepID=A0A9W6TQ61_9STRA|nr:unnamed protein product [Phytophthora lilii]